MRYGAEKNAKIQHWNSPLNPPRNRPKTHDCLILGSWWCCIDVCRGDWLHPPPPKANFLDSWTHWNRDAGPKYRHCPGSVVYGLFFVFGFLLVVPRVPMCCVGCLEVLSAPFLVVEWFGAVLVVGTIVRAIDRHCSKWAGRWQIDVVCNSFVPS